VDHEDTSSRATHFATANYYNDLTTWLNFHFDGLNSVDSLERFYIHLVDLVSDNANQHYKKGGKNIEVDWKQVVMPGPTEIFKVCRLLWQALVPIRNGVPDGQHRIAAMMKLLENWSITIHPTTTPPKTFVEDEKNYPNLNEKLDDILFTLQGKAMTRVIFPDRIGQMEEESQKYSLMREVSQSRHKPRMFKDM
jgi:hypothetical protein